MNVSRIMSPRRLEGGKRYAACLVPAFDVGVSRGLGDTPPLDGTMGPAWRLDATSDVRLPVYFHWEFATGPAGDFEELARRLQPFVAPDTVGVAPMYIGNAGAELPSIPAADPTAILAMDGALRAPKRSSGTLGDVPTAVELAREIFGTLNDRKVMIVGAGKMSELAARHLHSSGASRIFVTNRTEERAKELAAIFKGKIVDYDQFLDALPEMDIVITSSGAPFYIIKKVQMRRVIEARKNRPMFLIDIAVPRNIEPSVNEIDNVFLYDIDDLQRVVETNVGERKKRAEQAEKIVAEEVERMILRLRAREVAPTIVSLQDQLEQLRQAELARMRGKLGTLSPQQEEAIEALTRGLINKIAHGPISELRRQAGQPEGIQVIDAIRRLFRLEDGS
jgi:hypothetical protein